MHGTEEVKSRWSIRALFAPFFVYPVDGGDMQRSNNKDISI